MSKGLRSSLWITLLLAILGGCSMAEVMAPTPRETLFLPPLALPQHTAYVLSGILGGTNTFWLTLLDADTWQVIRRVQLPQAYTTHLSRDPQGRLWIGYLGLDWTEYRMQVFTTDGRLLQTLHPCRDPESGVQFASGKAFVMCMENGFFATVAVLDLATLSVETLMKLEWPRNNYLVYSSGGDENYGIVIGSHGGPRDTSYTGITLLNLQNQQVESQLNTLEDAYIRKVVPYQGQYYLLNAESWRLPRETAKDIFVVTPSVPPGVKTLKLPISSPNWGGVANDMLFTYHNPTKGGVASVASNRAVVRLDLKTGASQVWSLPDNWDANDLEVVNGKVILLKDDGVYEFNPDDGQLQKRVAISIPRQIVVSP